MNEEEWGYRFDIPGYPKYQLLLDDGAVKVVSFYKSPLGRVLGRTRSNGLEGYALWDDGVSKFFTVQQLKTIVERNKLKRIREDMNYIKTSTTGVVATGDYIVGSINKLTGAFSTSNHPAKHVSLASAKQEAARLANIDKSKKYVVMRAEAIASVEEVTWL